jgi:hypothetical protein
MMNPHKHQPQVTSDQWRPQVTESWDSGGEELHTATFSPGLAGRVYFAARNSRLYVDGDAVTSGFDDSSIAAMRTRLDVLRLHLIPDTRRTFQ